MTVNWIFQFFKSVSSPPSGRSFGAVFYEILRSPTLGAEVANRGIGLGVSLPGRTPLSRGQVEDSPWRLLSTTNKSETRVIQGVLNWQPWRYCNKLIINSVFNLYTYIIGQGKWCFTSKKVRLTMRYEVDLTLSYWFVVFKVGKRLILYLISEWHAIQVNEN